MHEADLVVLELSMRAPGVIRGREPVGPFGLEDAVDRVPVQVRQDMREDEGEVVEREASGAAQRADDGTLFLTGLPGQLVGSRRAVLAVGGPRLRHLRMVSVETP